MTMTRTTKLGLAMACALLLPVAQASAADLGKLPIPVPSDKATHNISVKVLNSPRTVDLPRSLRPLRVALLDKQELAPDDLRKLAERGETLAAAKYVQHLAQEDAKGNADLIARFGATAVGGGRHWVLDEWVASLHLQDPETLSKSDMNRYIRVLYPQAWAGNERALDAVIDFNGEGRLFGPLSSKTEARIHAQIEQLSSGRGDLKIAIAMLRKDTLTPDERQKVLAHLSMAQSSDYLAVATTAANLIEQLEDGTLGQTPTVIAQN